MELLARVPRAKNKTVIPGERRVERDIPLPVIPGERHVERDIPSLSSPASGAL